MVRPPGARVTATGPDRADGLHLPHGFHRRGEVHHRGPSVLQGHNNHLILSSRIREAFKKKNIFFVTNVTLWGRLSLKKRKKKMTFVILGLTPPLF